MALPAPDHVDAVQSQLLDWYQGHARDLPWRRTRDPYAILVSEIMLQQTQVDRVIPKYFEFLDRFPTLSDLAAATPGTVIRVWSPLGYNRRAVNLQRTAAIVEQDYEARLPAERKALERLPGIGRYTAAAVRCFAFGADVPVVDTNVRRVLCRLADAPQRGEREAQELAAAYLPPRRCADWNQALMDLGATLCRAKAPLCLLCPVAGLCPSRGRSALREARASYSSAEATRFHGSDRYLRGRIVDALRTVYGIPAETLAARFGMTDTPRADEINGADRRARRALVATDANGNLKLPD